MTRRNNKQGKAEVHVGDKWGHLECIERGAGEVITDEGDGITSTDTLSWFKCLCDCGNILKVWDRDYKGKMRIRDCGCGLHLLDGNIVQYGIHGPYQILKDLRREAGRRGWSKAQTGREALRLGLRAMEQETR